MEIHVHTKYSKDSLLCFWPLYLRCRINHISAIAITEHNNINGALQFEKFCEKRGGIKVIIGDEIFTKQGEIIGLYISSPIEGGIDAQDAIEAIQRQGGIVCVPHPYDNKRKASVLKEHVISEFKAVIDCIEVHNGRNINASYDILQNTIADRYGIPKVIGSDAHTLVEVGRNYMEVDFIPNNAEEFREVIKTATFHPMKCLMLSHKITKVAKLIKLICGKII